MAGSSASTQVIERLIVPCVGMGSIGLVVAHPAAAARKRSAAIVARRTWCCTGKNVARADYALIGRLVRRPACAERTGQLTRWTDPMGPAAPARTARST